MKNHLLIHVGPEAETPAAPSWTQAIQDKRAVEMSFHPELDALLRRYGVPVWVTSEYQRRGPVWSPEELASGLNRIYRLVLQEDREIPRRLIEDIRLLPWVRFARMGSVAQAAMPEFQMQVATAFFSNPSASRKAIGLEDAHDITRGDPSIVVAVIDTGVDLKHPELEGKLLSGYDFVDILGGADEFIGDSTGADPIPDDEVGHGTHVSGIIAGKGVDMPQGVAPDCKILPVRALAAMKRGNERVGAGLVDNINTAIKWAVDQGVDIINMSLGVRHESGGLPHQEVIDYAARKGVTIVAASGNDGRQELYFPGALRPVIATGAADEHGQVASFSTYGDHVMLIAPGENIYSSYIDERYAFASGTSQAAPFVSGAVALMKSCAKSQGRTLTDSQIKHILKHTSDKIDTHFKDPKAGFGCLNIADALRLLDDIYEEAA